MKNKFYIAPSMLLDWERWAPSSKLPSGLYTWEEFIENEWLYGDEQLLFLKSKGYTIVRENYSYLIEFNDEKDALIFNLKFADII